MYLDLGIQVQKFTKKAIANTFDAADLENSS